MAESLDLTTPVAGPSVTSYKIAGIVLQRFPRPLVRVRVLDNLNQESEFVYEGDTALTLLNQLNTMNFMNMSLEKRILQKLVSDGYIAAATVTGTPD